jgi:hypothetical protein
MRRPGTGAATAGALVLAALAAAALWLSVATCSDNARLERARPPVVYDFFSYYRPNAAYAFGRLRHGDVPLWNPLQQLGEPFLATLQTGVLYPPNWLHLLLPVQPAFAVLAAAHLVLAALLAGALARALGAGPFGAAAAGLLYAGSLELWGAVWAPPTLYAAAWAPGVLLAVDRIAVRASFGGAAALAVVLALQLLAGWPYTVAMTCGAAAILGLTGLVPRVLRERRLPTGAMAALAAGVLAGAALAAPQLLPAGELTARSTRALGTLDDATAGLEAPGHDPTRMLQTLRNRGVAGGVPGLASPLLALAAVALAARGARARCAALLGVGAVALAASFPHDTPVYEWLRHLPVLGDFRFPFRYRLLTTLALAVLSGVGVSCIAGRALRKGKARTALAAGLAALAVAAQAVPVARSLGRSALAFPRREAGIVAEWPAALAAVQERGAPSFRSWWRSFGIDKYGEREGIPVLQDLEPLSLAETSRMMTFLATGDAGVEAGRRRLVRSVLGAPYFGSVAIPRAASRVGLLDLMSVRYVATVEPAPPWLDTRWRRVASVHEPFLYENPAALPRARRLARAEPTPADPQAALERLVDPSFDPRTTVLLDPLPAEAAGLDASPDPEATTAFEVDEPEHVVIRTRGSRPAVLVLADAFYPGWQARLDGAPTPLLRADTAFRAVLVPPGTHRVEMRYRPRSFRLGVGLATLATVVLAAGAVASLAGVPPPLRRGRL